MKTIIGDFVSAFAIIGIAGILTTAAWAADAAAGRTLFATKCKNCHGAAGTPPAALAKSTGIKPLTDPSIQAKSDAVLKDEILRGVGKMKPQAVTPGQADNLVACIRSLK